MEEEQSEDEQEIQNSDEDFISKLNCEVKEFTAYGVENIGVGKYWKSKKLIWPIKYNCYLITLCVDPNTCRLESVFSRIAYLLNGNFLYNKNEGYNNCLTSLSQKKW